MHLKLKRYVSTLTDQTKNNIIQQQEKYKSRYDRYRTNPIFKIGDLVLIKTLNRRNKFDIRHEGPFRVKQQLGQKTYIVEHVKELTTRQVTSDIMMSIVQRRNIE